MRLLGGLLVLSAIVGFLTVLVWSSCRFYYFLFYVLHSYVDPDLRYAGLGAMVVQLWRRRKIRT